MPINSFKRTIAMLTIVCGIFFTSLMLLNTWFKIITDNSLIGKLTLTTGMLSVSFLALLAVLKLIESKQ